VTRCHICERPCEPEDDYLVAMRNGIYVDACLACWMRWPDGSKLFPPEGFGRGPAHTSLSTVELAELLGGPT